MERKLILLVTFGMLFFLCEVSGQIRNITITGRIDTALTNIFGTDELAIRVIETANHNSEGNLMKTKIGINGTFECILKSNSRLYLSFELLNLKSQYTPGVYYNVSTPKNRPLKEAYLFESGDSIKVDILRDGIIKFHGKGSAKLNCQWEIYNIETSPISVTHRITDLLNNGETEKGFLLQSDIETLALKLRMQILDSYKNELTQEIYDMLYLDAIAYNDYDTFHYLWTKCLLPNQDKDVVIKHYNLLVKKNDAINIDTNSIVNSVYYVDLIFQKEFCYSQIHTKNGWYNTGDSFGELYNRIKSGYQGELREKLMYICFQRLNNMFGDEAKSLVEDAMKTMGNGRYKQLLTEFKNKKYSAYPFELMDAYGNIHRLASYKGKVLVIDFWYTGCSYCANLNTAMSPIIQRFKDNSNIVFLTVSVDKKKSIWIKSLASGRYTSSETINLYTNGLGVTHPLIQNYNFTSFPAQLIIGKNGNLVTSFPPRVDAGELKKQQFLSIINNAIQSNYKM